MKRGLLFFGALLVSGLASAQLFINEVCPGNADITLDPDYFNFSGYVELFNSGSTTLDIGGYYLTDNDNKTEWKVPSGTKISAKGFLLIWCDKANAGLHTSFSLSSDGETLLLSSPGLAEVDKIAYPKTYVNVAYGRKTDGAATWSFLNAPSPKTANTGTDATTRLDGPMVSDAAGRYGSAISVQLTNSNSAAEIHYTLDGSEPTINSTKYTTPLAINSTLTLKAKAFAAGYLPSKTEINTYFINEHTFTIPVVSLSTKPTYLWDNTIGIYTDGTNGVTGNCQNQPKNWNRDWDRHADFEYFDAKGTRTYDQSIDLRIAGACSRGNPQKSFAVQSRNKYGKTKMTERFFPEKDISEYSNIFLRNSGNDFNVTMFRDAFMQTLAVREMDVDYMAYQPSALYINGQYWGIQSLREKIDGEYFESNYGIDKSDIDLMEFEENVIEGTKDAWVNYRNTLQNMDPNSPATFKYIDDHIDVQEYINYLVSEIYYCNTDWPGNNVKYWRQRSTNGKFRWIFWDTDFGFALYAGSSYYNHPTLNFATDPNSGVDWPNPPWSTLHIRLVLQNPEFRSRFIQTLTTAMSTTFKPERVNKVVDEFKEAIKAEVPYHIQRWGQWTVWEDEVQRLKDFGASRNTFMQQHTADFFGLGDKVNMSVSTTPANTGTFKLNGIKADENLVDGAYFRNLRYTVEAIPNAGYAFKSWKITKRASAPVTFITKGDTWKYNDQGTDLGTAWKASSFIDNSWASGPAQLGYGGDGEVTTVSYGSDAANKYITTYFRKTFTVSNLSGLQNLSGSVMFDDGVVVYVNGTEVFRNNMPDGSVNYNTLASTTIPVEKVFYPFTVDKSLLAAGNNTIAVEVHQVSAGSSDVSFDLSLTSSIIGNEVVTTSNVELLTDTAYSDVILEATYEQLNSVSGIVINEFSAADSNVKDDKGESSDWIELYNTSSKAVDVAGLFITDNKDNKTKFKIPSGGNKTIMQPDSYLVLWADDEVTQGVTHANFKLSADGEEIGLYQVVGNDTLTMDELSYESQFNNTSMARLPNGTGPFARTKKLTPGAVNQLDVVTGIEGEFASISVYPNPAGHHIAIRSVATIDNVVVFDMVGAAVKSFYNPKSEEPLSIENLSSGIYLVRVKAGGAEKVVRIVKQ